jgi:transcriptional regulator NrdR family protein
LSNRKYITPKCPHCGTLGSKVYNTYYSPDGQIVRHRKCNDCDHKWYTSQSFEEHINASLYHVYIPNRHTYAEGDPRSLPKYCEVRHVNRQK